MHTQLTRRCLVLAAALAAAVPLSACGGEDDDRSTLEQLREAGTVRIAIANEPPLTEVKPDRTLGGIVPDTIKAVMKRLGVPHVTGVVSTYDAMIRGCRRSAGI